MTLGSVSQQEVTDLKDAKQLLIQQKLELQGKVDNVNSALEQEKKNQQAAKEQLKKREEELKKECAEVEAKLVSVRCTLWFVPGTGRKQRAASEGFK